MKLTLYMLSFLFSINLWASGNEYLVSYHPSFSGDIKTEYENLKKDKNILNVDRVSLSPLLFSIKVNSFKQLSLKVIKNKKIDFIERDFSFSIPTVDPNSQLNPNDPKLKKQWAFNTKKKGSINIQNLWQQTIGSKAVKVAVLDTGIDYNHKDLVDNIWVNQKEKNGLPGIDDDNNGFVDDIYGYDFINNDNDPMDDNNHGTHVAGIIGAQSNNGYGVAGTAWDVTMLSLKIARADRGGKISSAIKAMDYAMNKGAKIINMSFGSYNYSQAFYNKLLEAKSKNVLVVAVAGNDGKDTDKTPFYPAGYSLDNIIRVGSSTSSAKLSGFSNYGKQNVDLLAPGSNIYSTIRNNKFGIDNGTSFAAPYVSGAAVLLMSLNPGASYWVIKNKILNGVRIYSGLEKRTKTSGVLDVYRAAKL